MNAPTDILSQTGEKGYGPGAEFTRLPAQSRKNKA